MIANTSYDFRAYVETSQDTTRGNTMTFTTLANVLPNVTTTIPTNVTQTTANFNGTTAPGTESIQARGFEYKLTSTTSWTGAIDLTATGTSTITSPATGLIASTQYDVRAYAQTLSDGRTYGNIVTFTTLGLNPPTVVTLPATSITQTSAILNGTVTAGTGTITAQGFEWRQVGTTSWATVSATGATMTYTLPGLTANTNYEYRAFATSGGTVYGLTVTFITDQIPVVPGSATTQAATNIDTTHAVLHGTLVDVGNALSNIEVGFVYSTLTDPELGGTNVITVPVTYTEGMTTFSAPISGLQPSTSYFFKAYVNNSAGPGYGAQETFVTLADTSSLTTVDPNQFTVTMYPNPATSTTKLVVSGVEGETDIAINDVQGKLIYKTTAKAVNGKVEKTIDVNNFVKGVYYVRIQNQTTSKTQKLIVQ